MNLQAIGAIAFFAVLMAAVTAVGWRRRHPKPQARQASPSSAPAPAPVPGHLPPPQVPPSGGQSPAPGSAERQP